MIAHAGDHTLGGLEGSVSKMLTADPDFRKYYMTCNLEFKITAAIRNKS